MSSMPNPVRTKNSLGLATRYMAAMAREATPPAATLAAVQVDKVRRGRTMGRVQSRARLNMEERRMSQGRRLTEWVAARRLDFGNNNN